MLLRKLRIKCLQLLADYLVVADDVVGFCGHEMENRFCALDMLQKFCSESLSFGCALDKAGNVRDDELVVRAETRLERRECIIPHTALRRSERIQKRRFARIRESYEADIRDKPQLESVVNRISQRSLFKFRRTRVGRRAKFKIAASSYPTAGG